MAADDETAALGALTELGFQLGLPRGLGREQLLRTLWERLSELSDWLLVLDNAGPPAQARWLLPHQWSRGSVLITSLDPTWDSVATPVRVAPLATPDAVALLRRRTQAAAEGDRAGRSGNEAEVRLAQELGGLPLALEQACHFMSQTGTSVAGYLTLFSSRRAALLARGAPADHPSPATTTWHLLFESVRRRSPAAAEMLEVASFLSPDGVAWSVLAPGGADSAEDQLARLDAVVELVSCSLVDRDDAELRVHRLVQTVVREGLDPQQRKRRASAATAALRRAMPAEASRTATWPAWSVLMPQVEALLRACAEVRVVPEGLTPLVCGCATYLRYRSGLLLARSLLDLAVGLAHDLEAEHHDQAILRAQRSEILDDLGLLQEARADILAALTLAGPAAVSTADVETARTWARLAHVLSCADERAAAVDLYSRAILVLRAERELEDLVNALIGLAYTHWGQDDHVAAAEDSRQAVALLEQAGWTGHPLHAASISALGMMLHEVGRYEEARDLQLTALRELRLIHGDVDHHDIAYVHDKLGYVQGLLGDHRASLASHQSASDMLTALFGTHDSRRAVALSNRGLAERALGDVDAARRSQQEAYTLLLSAFGTDHKLTRLVRDRLAELAAPPPR